MSGWLKHKLKSRLLGEISITSDIKLNIVVVAMSFETQIKQAYAS